MKYYLRKAVAAIIAVTLMLTVSLALAETKITVTGTGEIQVSADTATVSLGVNARDKDVLVAQQKANETISAIRKALMELGVPEECINTEFMDIYPIYDYDSDQEQVQAYNAGSTLAIKVTDINIAGQVVDSAFAAGANTLNGISFTVSDTDAARAEALKKAVTDARSKAEALAEAAGLTITEAVTITEGGTFSLDNVNSFAAKGTEEKVSAANTVVQPAKLIVSASITITYETE